MKYVKQIQENTFKNYIQKHNRIFYGGSYGDPTEFGYKTIYVYYFLYHGNIYTLDTDKDLNQLIDYYCKENQEIIFKRVPQSWYKLGLI